MHAETTAPVDPDKAAADQAAADVAKAEVDRVAGENKAAGTTTQQNAAEKANNYLSTAAFSRKGFIEQLEFEGFTAAQRRTA